MIKLKNSKTKVPKLNDSGKEVGTLDYKDLIKVCLNSAPEGGFTREDFKKRDRIEATLTGETFKLEDEDVKNLKQIVGAMHWVFRHDDLSLFTNTIEKL